MNSATPPPLPNTEAALLTYLRAGFFLLPAFVVWLFTRTFLLPRLEMVWERAGISPSRAPRAQFLLDTSDAFASNFWLIAAFCAAIVVVLELFVARWHRYRRMGVGAVAFLLNAGVLVGLTVVSTTALLAVPLVLKSP